MDPPQYDFYESSPQDEDDECSQDEDLCDTCRQQNCPRCIEKAEERREFLKKLYLFAVGIWLGFNLARRC